MITGTGALKQTRAALDYVSSQNMQSHARNLPYSRRSIGHSNGLKKIIETSPCGVGVNLQELQMLSDSLDTKYKQELTRNLPMLRHGGNKSVNLNSNVRRSARSNRCNFINYQKPSKIEPLIS